MAQHGPSTSFQHPVEEHSHRSWLLHLWFAVAWWKQLKCPGELAVLSSRFGDNIHRPTTGTLNQGWSLFSRNKGSCLSHWNKGISYRAFTHDVTNTEVAISPSTEVDVFAVHVNKLKWTFQRIYMYLRVCMWGCVQWTIAYVSRNHEFIMYLSRLDILDPAFRKQIKSIQRLPCFELLCGYKTCL